MRGGAGQFAMRPHRQRKRSDPKRHSELSRPRVAPTPGADFRKPLNDRHRLMLVHSYFARNWREIGSIGNVSPRFAPGVSPVPFASRTSFPSPFPLAFRCGAKLKIQSGIELRRLSA
jgi:hypothetical protein